MITDDEPSTTVDNYQRTKSVTNAAAAIANVDGLDEFSVIAEHDEAWWAEHDAKVERNRKLDEARARAEQHLVRAHMLKNDEHRFPRIAVDGALIQWNAVTPAMAAVIRFATSPQLLLVLAGGVGTGKSTAATWAALEIGGSSPAFLRVSELEARGRYDKDLRTWLRSTSMLVLDDLGAEVLDGRGVFRSLLDELVDAFYGDRKRLVITTNLRRRKERPDDEPQLAERYGDRVTSRLSEIGLWADCGAVDLRRTVRR